MRQRCPARSCLAESRSPNGAPRNRTGHRHPPRLSGSSAAAGDAALRRAGRVAVHVRTSSPRIDGCRYLDGHIDVCQYEAMRLIAQLEECCASVVEAPLDAGEAETLGA